ncbi:MAG: glutathione S-transferase family protein [Alphaproteobacteria bacterium]
MMIKLIYFDFNFWRVDILRLCLSYSSIPYELQRIKRQDWKKKKNQFPFGQLPVMQVNNQFFSHTHSLAKFCANQASLYEQDEFKMLIVDQVLDWANEITNHIAPSIRAAMREKNFEKSRELRKEFIKNDLKRWFYYLENLLKRSSENKDFFTDKFGIADITAWRIILWFTSGKLDEIDSSFLNYTPLLKKYYDGISNYEPFTKLKVYKKIVS